METTVGQSTYRDLARKETELQKQVIKISEENIELRFECEQSKKDIPRLKVSRSAAALLQSRMLHKNALLKVCSRDVEFCALVYVVVVVGAH